VKNAEIRLVLVDWVASLLFSSTAFAAGELFNFGWNFCRGDVPGAEKPAFDDSGWRAVDLPHDFQIEMPWCKDAYSLRGFKQTGTGWYRKRFDYSTSWRGKVVSLDFGGIMFNGDIWVNGRHVAATDAGYFGFEVDVTDALHEGENVVAVRADTGPRLGARWYTGGGVYRDVRLLVHDRVRISRHGVYVTTPVVTPERATVCVRVELDGYRDATNALDVCVRIVDPSGRQVAEKVVRAPMHVKQRCVSVDIPEFELAHPCLWGCDSPALYRAEVVVSRASCALDSSMTRFGVRKIEYGPSFGFRLNGRKVFLKGVAGHHDLGSLGAAVFDRAIRRRLEVLKSFGFNAVRCSHNPYSESFLDLADELGFLVVDEFVDAWSSCWAGRRSFLAQWPELCTEWVRRDRNHPSVILWSLGNETQADDASGYRTDDFGVTTYRLFDVMTKRWDSTRPTTVALYPGRKGDVRPSSPDFFKIAEPPELAPVMQVASFNYYGDLFKGYRALYPEMIFLQSEVAVQSQATGYYRLDFTRDVGLCYWGAVSYWGESHGWPKKGWDYAFFRHTMAPLPGAYLMKSVFTSEPIVHVSVKTPDKKVFWNDATVGVTGWTDDWNLREGTHVDVEVFSNQKTVELFLNGRSLGKNERVSCNRFVWSDVAWEAGSLEASAYSGERAVARDRLETVGAAVGLEVVPENPFGWQADGLDLQYVRLRAVDASGRRVRQAKGTVRVAVSGSATLLATDDGDMSTDRLPILDVVPLVDGEAYAILRSKRRAGSVTLTADGGVLGAKVVNLETQTSSSAR